MATCVARHAGGVGGPQTLSARTDSGGGGPRSDSGQVPSSPANLRPSGILSGRQSVPPARTNGRLEQSIPTSPGDTYLADNPAFGVNMARQGFVVFTWDMVGWNHSKQIPHEFGLIPREQIWGFGPLGLQLWNSTRALDFLQSLSDVDPERIAMTGAFSDPI